MIFQKIQEAANFIKSKTSITPKVGIVLGSGLGVYVDQIENKTIIPYTDIPHFHATSVAGHDGRLVLGQVKGVDVAVYQGRFHVYEGHQLDDVVLRVLSLLGAKYLLLTNAAGGINSAYVPGDLVCIKDHINLTGRNPLVGKNIDELGPRFPDMTETYNLELQELMVASAKELDFELPRGVYAAMLGPTYETPAEIGMLKIIGSDMVGMSTVPEAIAAHHAGLKVGGISCITNLAAGISPEKLDHDDVKEVAKLAMIKFSNLLTRTVEKIGALDS
jgi:purine-nucleoside phosphorylase